MWLSCSGSMCVWHSGDIPRSTNVVRKGVPQKRHLGALTVFAGAAVLFMSAALDLGRGHWLRIPEQLIEITDGVLQAFRQRRSRLPPESRSCQRGIGAALPRIVRRQRLVDDASIANR